MKVVTPTIKLDVRVDTMTAADGRLSMTGVAGMLPCDVSLTPQEMRKLLRMAMRPGVLRLLLGK